LPEDEKLKDEESVKPAFFNAVSTSRALGLPPADDDGTCKTNPLGIFPIDRGAVSLKSDILLCIKILAYSFPDFRLPPQ